MTRQVRRGEYTDEYYDDETGETWTEGEDADVVAKCDRCGDELKDSDESLALVGADGQVHHFCRYCVNHAAINPESVITDILEAAGVWYATGWADENDEAARSAAERQKTAGVPAKRVIMIQQGVRV
jgi:hypothetical protein